MNCMHGAEYNPDWQADEPGVRFYVDVLTAALRLIRDAADELEAGTPGFATAELPLVVAESILALATVEALVARRVEARTFSASSL